MTQIIKRADAGHEQELLQLYLNVAEFPDGIIRKKHEITLDYIKSFYSKAMENGLMLFAMHEDQIVGEIHAYTPNIYAFQHILTDLTIVVRSDFQGKGIGRNLFSSFLTKVSEELKHILRIELYTREHNSKNVVFYESLGFINEGRQKNKIFHSPSQMETPLHMAWFNPNFSYH